MQSRFWYNNVATKGVFVFGINNDDPTRGDLFFLRHFSEDVSKSTPITLLNRPKGGRQFDKYVRFMGVIGYRRRIRL